MAQDPDGKVSIAIHTYHAEYIHFNITAIVVT